MNKAVFTGILAAGLLGIAIPGYSRDGSIVLQNSAFRLELQQDGTASSLLVDGEECLDGRRISFCTLTQERPYDNENFLIFPAKPKVFPSNRIIRDGDTLRVDFQDTYDRAVIALDIRDTYIGFRLVRVDYRIEDLGIKRKTEIDAFTLLQLPVRRREHFGEWLNVTWDGERAVCILGTDPKTRIDAVEDGGILRMSAGMEDRIGLLDCRGAALVATRTGRFLDTVRQIEEDYDLPPGVDSRRSEGYRDSYYELRDFDLSNIDRHLSYAKAGGFRAVVIYYRDFATTCGHFLWNDRFPEGLRDLKAVCDRIRLAGMVPGLHIHYSKVSVDDPSICGGIPDARLNEVAGMLLKEPLDPTQTRLVCASVPANLRMEEGRRLLRAGDEFISYTSIDGNTLTGCERGLYGTRPSAHPAGTLLRQPDVDDWPRFIRISQDGGLQEEIAGRLAEIYRTCGFRFLYFDGAEDVPSPYWYNVSRAQLTVYNALPEAPIYSEGSLKSHFGWHILTRGNAFDIFPPERIRTAFRQYTLRGAARNADDFTAVDFGWTGYELPDSLRKGSQPDTYEYICSKALAWDSPFSQIADLDNFDRHPRTADNLEVMRRWEEAKRENRFSPEEKQRLKDPDREFVLLEQLYEYYPLPDRGNIRGFLLERNGKNCLLYWNMAGEDTLTLDIPGRIRLQDTSGRRVRYVRKGNRITLPAGKRMILETELGREALSQAFTRP